MRIGILGAKGFVGSELAKVIGKHHEIHTITRANYAEKQGESYDLLINANGNSKRYWANNNILEDFQLSTASVYDSFFHFKSKRYIYISSADVYEQHDSPTTTDEKAAIKPDKLCAYGFHKYLSELIVKRYSPQHLILRCSAMVGENMVKGPVIDILNGSPLFISQESKLQFVSTTAVAEIILNLMDQNIYNCIVNVGGIGAVSIKDIQNMAQTEVPISPDAPCQTYEMNVTKLNKLFPLRTSKTYIQEYLDITRR